MSNKYLEKIAFALPTRVFKSSVTQPKIFNLNGRAIVKKPIGTLINPGVAPGVMKNKIGITQKVGLAKMAGLFSGKKERDLLDAAGFVMSGTGLGVGLSNYKNNKRTSDSAAEKSVLESKSLAALNKIHKTLQAAPVVKVEQNV